VVPPDLSLATAVAQVWDSYGRPLYQSSAFEHSITSLAWTPGGDRFAVGSYNCLALCDKMGWMHSKAHTASGSLFSLAWASDGMQVAAGGGTGGVDFAAVVEVEAEDGRVHAVLEDSKRVVAHDVVGGGREVLDFRDRVVNMALGGWAGLVCGWVGGWGLR
jgi:intraflagellar transport protein 80